MRSYQYTYPEDLSYLDVLPDHQRRLALNVLHTARQDGADLNDVLHAVQASPEDKAALASVWAGPDAAKEFLP